MWGERGAPDRIGIGLIAAFVGVVVLSVVGACSGDPAPVGPGPTGATATSSAPVTPKPQAPAQEPTPESAIEFTRYFWELYNYAYETYDTVPLKAISDPGCKFCASTVANLEKMRTTGSKAAGFRVEIIETIAPPGEITTGTLVVVVIKQEPGTIQGPDGTVDDDPGWRRLRTDFSLVWDGKWRVEAMDADRDSGTR